MRSNLSVTATSPLRRPLAETSKCASDLFNALKSGFIALFASSWSKIRVLKPEFECPVGGQSERPETVHRPPVCVKHVSPCRHTQKVRHSALPSAPLIRSLGSSCLMFLKKA